MVFRRVVLLTLLLLTLAGCYRQADENFQPVTIPADGQTTMPVVTTMPTETPSIPGVIMTSTDSGAFTTDEPTPEDMLDEETPDNQATETPPLVITIEPTETEAEPQVDEPTAEEEPTTLFITPGQPDLPVTIETSTPANTTSTPSGLITPTDFFNTGTEESNLGDECEYVVQRGDTLYSIALEYGIFLSDLREANPDVSGELIIPGDTLIIPGCGEETEDEVTATPTPEEEVEGGVVHVVQRGESLYTIAQQYGITVQDIVDANELINPNRIDIGQRLIIPTDEE